MSLFSYRPLSRRLLAFGFIAFASHLVLVGQALAGETKPFTQAEFDRLNSASQSIVVAAHADWCPTCRAQKPVLDALMKTPEFKTYTLLSLNYDKDKPVLKALKIKKQSTVVVFKGGRETARSVGQTSAKDLSKLLVQAN
jgi:thioredoxin 1